MKTNNEANVRKMRVYSQGQIMARAVPRINSKARVIFERAKAKILDEFESHPITVAIEEHGWVDGLDSGTLFGFIGFHEGDDPLKEARDILQSDFVFLGVQRIAPTQIRISFSVPDKQDIFDATPTEWAEGRSWTEMLESGGISGVGHYLAENGRGRSEEGVQIKGKLRDGKLAPRKYISDFLKRAEKQIRKQLREELIFA